jgi:hypothetical protein
MAGFVDFAARISAGKRKGDARTAAISQGSIISTSVPTRYRLKQDGPRRQGLELDELDASLNPASATAARTDAAQVHGRSAVPLIAAH